MEYILVMAFSGSTMTLLCLLLRSLLKDRISARIYYLLAKAAVLYYLVPLPFLKRWYGEIIRAVMPKRQMRTARIPLRWTNYAVHADEKIYVNVYAGIQIVLVSVWLAVACFLIARQLAKYLRTVRLIAGYTSTKMTDRQETFLAGLKEEYGIRRHVLLYQGDSEDSSMTFGMIRPVIICSKEIGSLEAELLTRHELVHIRRLDACWKILMECVTYLHWWNPVMWKLNREIDRVCEMSCDETAMSGRTEEEVKRYLLLLIEESQMKKEPAKVSVRWRAGFGENARKIKERVENLMRKKKGNRFAAGVLVATLVFANSMTVFAYRDVVHETITEEVSQEEIDRALQIDEALFVPGETAEEATAGFSSSEKMEILYENQFVDEEGNIYPIPDAAPQRGCNHDYESGTWVTHDKKSDGSCEVREYRAQMCSKCSSVIRGEQIGWRKYDVCPH